MNPVSLSSPGSAPVIPTCRLQWLMSAPGRFMLLSMALVISLPPDFSKAPDVGLDPSWQLSLQWATVNGKIFGRDFVFTYGPLGYLLIHVAANKGLLLLYDFFVLGSLLSIYRSLLRLNPTAGGIGCLTLLAIVTKTCWVACPAAILFTILCHWLWQIYDRCRRPAIACALFAALVLFFGKINYSLIMIFLIPAYGLTLWQLHPARRTAAIWLLFGFPVLIGLGSLVWHVDLPRYLRSSVELIAGYNESMYAYPIVTPWALWLAGLFLTSMGAASFLDRHSLRWREQALLLPLIFLDALLLFKNAFTRSDDLHQGSFAAALPLLLAIWYIGWRGTLVIKILLIASLIQPLALLVSHANEFTWADISECTPLNYVRQLATTPVRVNADQLQSALSLRYPQAAMPAEIRTTIGQSSVDIMPWESSIAFLNGLNYRPRPVPQSYSVYTPWLDDLNAAFVASTNAPDYLLFACEQTSTINSRPMVWDESRTRMALIENYTYQSTFDLPQRVPAAQGLDSNRVFLLKHSPHVRRFTPIATNEITLDLGQTLVLPPSTNLYFLTLDIHRTLAGKLAAALSPAMLLACCQYQDGRICSYRAVLPILETGVLVNRRIESPDEIRNWLANETARDAAVAGIHFKASEAWAFQTPFKGFLIEYRLIDNEAAPQ